MEVRPVPAYDWTAFHADARPEKPAMVDDFSGRRFTYAELEERCSRLAAWLAGEGIGQEDRVAVLSANRVEVFEALFACAKLGAILVPLNWRLAAPELEFIVGDSDPAALIWEEQFAEAAARLRAGVLLELDDPYEEALAASDPLSAPTVTVLHDDPWCIMYTSGTTGRPKGAIVTHGMVFWNAINIGAEVGLTRASVNLDVLPTFHTGGLNLYATPCIRLGATVVLMREFDPERLLHWLASGEITHFFGVPAVYQFTAEHPGWESADLSGVDSWGTGGSAIPVALLERYAERGVVIRQGMGLTETSPTLFLVDEAHALSKAGSVGKPVLHTAIRVVDADGGDVPRGEIGELWVRGPNVTPGYWNREEADQASFTDGWFHTGDAVRQDEEGYVYVVDRWKDMYVSGGENVYPAEVEQVLFRHPEVADAAVVGVPDERWGEVGVAVVVPRRAAAFDPEDLLSFCEGELARYKIPRRVQISEELPRNAAGKVLKRELRDHLIG